MIDMKKRVMKKWIPKNTMYCYKIKSRNSDGSFKVEYCKHFGYLRTIRDFITSPEGVRLMAVDKKVYICKFTGITTEDDFCLYDSCKVCGAGEPKF